MGEFYSPPPTGGLANYVHIFINIYSTSHRMKSEFLCSLWQRKESFMPFMVNCKMGFYVFYRKVAIKKVFLLLMWLLKSNFPFVV